MALPTRDELNDEVDRRFHERFTDAPARLDPDDPGHATWIDEWVAIRDAILTDWTDEAFAGFFPDAGRLDPDDSGDTQLIDYWKDIRDQIRDGRPGRYSWDGDAPAAAAARVSSVDHDPAGGWVVTFDRPVSVEQAERFLWPDGVPDDVRVAADSPEQIHLRGLGIEAVQSMTPEVSRQITSSVLSADPPGDPGSDPSSDSPSDPADIDVEMDESTRAEIAEWTEHALHDGHALASTVEVTEYLAEATAHLAGHAGRAAALAEAAGAVSKVLGPVSEVFLVIWVGYQVVDAFMAEKRSSKRQGFVYGLMWQALDEPDHLPAFVDGMTYSADERREAFQEGIDEGRAKAQDPTVRNQIILAVATLGLSSGYGDFYAANQVLSQLWRAHREESPGDSDTDTLRWPVPFDRN